MGIVDVKHMGYQKGSEGNVAMDSGKKSLVYANGSFPYSLS